MSDIPSPGDSFVSGSHTYEILRILVLHPDYDTLLLASRRPTKKGAGKPVMLRPVPLLYGPETLGRVEEEVRVFKMLKHPNVAEVLGVAVHPESGTPYVISKHTRGCSLLTALTAAVAVGRTLSPAFGAYVAAEVAHALEAAHQAETEDMRPLQLVHRAVSPMNIRLGDRGRVRLTNFGAAYTTLPERFPTPPDVLRGDPAYAAPEIFRGYMRERNDGELPPRAFDARADLFSLGLVLLEALTAIYPLNPPEEVWRGLKVRFPSEVLTERSSILPLHLLADRVLHFGPEEVTRTSTDLPPALRSILARALSQDPAARYPSASLMRGHLLTYLGSLKQPYGRADADAELSSILKEAAENAQLVGLPGVERGVLRNRRVPLSGTKVH